MPVWFVDDLDQRHDHGYRLERSDELRHCRCLFGGAGDDDRAARQRVHCSRSRQRRGQSRTASECIAVIIGQVRRSRSRAAAPRRHRETRVSVPWLACAPTGSEQPLPSSARNARSTSTARRLRRMVDGREHVGHLVVVGATLDRDATLPGARHEGGRRRSSAIRSRRPRISSAATAITIAPPSGTLPSRVWMLPRSSTKSRSGRTAASCARRRTEPVATVAPSEQLVERRPTSASRGVAPFAERGDDAGRRPTVDGRSLAECTAMSARRRARRAAPPSRTRPARRSCAAGRPGVRSPMRLDEHQLDRQRRREQPSTHRRRPRPACGLRAASGGDPQQLGHRTVDVSPRSNMSRHRGGVALALRRAGVVLQLAPTAGAAAWRRCPW